MKYVAAGFAIFLVLIVFAANMGLAKGFFRLMYNIPYCDKLGHFFLMGTLTLLVNLALSASEYRFFNTGFLKGSLVIIIVVTLEELSQIFVKNRTFSFTDLVCDYAGIYCFGIAARHIVRRRNSALPAACEK